MILYANATERVRLNTVSLIRRTILGSGSLTVSLGQEVRPEDILGKYQTRAGFTTINLAKELSVSKSSAGKFLTRKKGDKIFEGELLAQKKGIFGETNIITPSDAIVDDYFPDRGEVRLQFLPKDVSLTSGVYGIVEVVDKERGEIVIKALVNELFGIVGSGNQRGGILRFINERGNVLTSQLKPDFKHAIIVGGDIINKETLQKAVEIGISGIISGGVNLSDYLSLSSSIQPQKRIATDIGITVLATEGFGLLSLGKDILEMLKKYEGKFIFINGNSRRIMLPVLERDSIITLRKTALSVGKITAYPEHQPELTAREIKVGDKVRIIWPPFMGSQGKVVAIDKTVTRLPSGIVTYLLTIEIPTKKLKVPYLNVELI